MSVRISSFLRKCCTLERIRKALRTRSNPLELLSGMPHLSPYLASKASSSSPSGCLPPAALIFLSTRRKKKKSLLLNTAGAKERQCKGALAHVLSQGRSKSMLPRGSNVLIPVLCGFHIHSSTRSADRYLVFPWSSG